MTARIPEAFLDLISDNTPAFAILGTMMPDGSPQATPVWFDSDGDLLCVNSKKGRVKDLNMRVRPEVVLTIIDPDNWYRYLQVRGEVIEITEQGGREHIDRLAGKYTGKPEFRGPPDDVRVTYRIRPGSISAMG